MKQLDPNQVALAASGRLAVANLVRLVTYQDRIARIIDRERWISDASRVWTWDDGTDRNFEPWLLSIDPLRDTMPHLPDLGGGGRESAQNRLRRLKLVNFRGTVEGAPSYLWEELANENVVGALVEIAQLIVDRGQDLSLHDLRPISDSQTWLYRGRVSRVEGVTEAEIALQLETDAPVFPWVIAAGPQVDPKDTGKRLPIVLGQAKITEGIGWITGGVTTVAEKVTAGAAGLPVTNLDRIPGSGRGIIGDDTITWTGVGVTPTIVGVEGMLYPHNAGELLFAEPTGGLLVFVLNARPSKAVNDVYILSPINDELVRIADQTLYSVNLNDTLTVPGQVVTTISFTEANLRRVLEEHAKGAGVIQQPRRSTDTIAQGSGSPFTFGYENTGTGSTVSEPVNDPQDIFGSGSQNFARIYEDGIVNATFSSDQNSGNNVITRQTIAFYATKTGNDADLQVWAVENDEILVAWIRDYEWPGSSDFFQRFSYNLTGAGADSDEFEFRTVNTDSPSTSVKINRFERDNGEGTSGRGIDQQPEVAENPGTAVVISGSAVGYGLRVFADVDGPEVLPGFPEVYGFEETAEFTTDNVTISTDVTESISGASLKLEVPALVPDYEDDMDAVGNWVLTTGGTLETETVIVAPTGSVGSLKLTADVAQDFNGMVDIFVGGARNYTGRRFQVWVRLDQIGFMTPGLGLFVQLYSSYPAVTSWWEVGTDYGIVAGEWFLFDVDLTQPPSGGAGGGANLGAITAHAFAIRSSQEPVVWYLDELSIRDEAPNGVAQKNASLSLGDWTADSDRYRLWLRVEGLTSLERLDVGFSDEVTSGTTEPSAYKEIQLGPSTLGDSVWQQVDRIALDTGAPTVANVRTLRVEIDVDGTLPVTVWLDVLAAASDVDSPYDAALGEVIESGPDIVRYVLGELSQPPQVWDDASFGDTAFKLGANIYGGDLRDFGAGFGSVIAGLAWNTRSSIVQAERASGTVFRMLTALADHSWPQPQSAITQWTQFAEVVGGTDELITRAEFLYDLDHSVRAGELERYRQAESIIDDAAERRYGRLDGVPLPFDFVQDDPTAKELAAYYAWELAKESPIWIIEGVPFWEHHALEIGDLVSLTPPWRGVVALARVLELERFPETETASVRLIEVQ